MTNGTPERRARARLQRVETERFVQRVWDRDVSVWGGEPDTPELGDRLGWLDLPATMGGGLRDLTAFAAEARARFDRVVLCGMGGSSLAPEVLWRVFGPQPGYPALHLLDSTHPDAVAAAAPDAVLARTLFLIASKSGTTIETASFERYFWERSGGNGSQFVAVTDPGTALARGAAARGFARVFESPPDVGGRFSALSPFGLVPAALIGVNVERLLARAAAEAEAARRPPPENPGARLGAVLGETGALTLLLDDQTAALGLWAEQLVAESTGKAGQGILPVWGEDPALLTGQEPDRAWVMRTRGAPRGALADLLPRLRAAGAALDQAALDDPYDLGADFFRFEFATAIAGALLGVNPFDQPNVAESKRNTSAVLDRGASLSPAHGADALERWLGAVARGGYVAVMAYLAPDPATDDRLRRLQRRLGARLRVPVTMGYGPRFLHSTGQLHKGGPPRGHFLQIVARPARDVPIPGAAYGFARLISAQAEGDLEALRARGRPVIRIDDWSLLDEVVR